LGESETNLKKLLNTEALNSDSHLRHFCTKFRKKDKRLLLTDVQILSLNPTDKLYDDFTTEDINKFVLSIKKDKATGCDDIPAKHGICWF
jgi:hypothetical protein